MTTTRRSGSNQMCGCDWWVSGSVPECVPTTLPVCYYYYYYYYYYYKWVVRHYYYY